MAIIKHLVFKIVLTITILFSSCLSSKQMVEEIKVTNIPEINIVINEARIEIDKVLQKKKISPNNKEFVYLIFAFVNMDENKNFLCSEIKSVKSFNDLYKLIGFGSNWVHALVSDQKYIATVAPYYINTSPEVLTSYPFELSLIHLAKEENYTAFISLVNCSGNYYGIKMDQIDVLSFENEEFRFVRTLELK